MPKSKATYADRDIILLSIGYSSYDRYLESDLWAVIRDRVIRRTGGICRICGSLARDVHHHRYDKGVLLGQDDGGLVPLCGGCHYRIEFDADGKKRTLDKSQSAYKQLRGHMKSLGVNPTNAPGRCLYCGAKARTGKIVCKSCRKKRGGSRPEIGLAHKRKHLLRQRLRG